MLDRLIAWLLPTRLALLLARRHGARLAPLLTAACLLLLSNVAQAQSVNLLASAKRIEASQVTDPERLTDGVAAIEGDDWKSDLTSLMQGTQARVVWDFGRPLTLGSVYIQADNNDHYRLESSLDGKSYGLLWSSGTLASPGMRSRLDRGLKGEHRFIRLTVTGGDSSYGLSELSLAQASNAPLDRSLTRRKGRSLEERLRERILFFGLAGVAAVVLSRRRGPAWLTPLLALLPLGAGLWFFQLGQTVWPLAAREISLLRATAAGIGLGVIAWETWSPEFLRPNRKAVFGGLGLAAMLAIASFYNLGRPQFWDQGRGEARFLHDYDMRVYYPVAKYFRELKFDGLYMASVAAYLDDQPHMTARHIASTPLRDLRTHDMTRVSEIEKQLPAVRQRFSAARWSEFVKDMRYFRLAMGPGDYLGSMQDHGGNATPFWLFIAHLLFFATSASNGALWVGALLDPLLLGIAFFAIGRSFGWRTALVSMILFGANDFYMFGSNWAGATLRHDWMAYLALGLCALATRRWTLGGVFLALSSMVRAFPALSLIGVSLPGLMWLFDELKTHKRFPSWQRIKAAQGPLLKIALGASVTLAIGVLLSSLVLGFDAWPAWLAKVSVLEKGSHVNHISLRMLLSFDSSYSMSALARGGGDWTHLQVQTFQSRFAWFVIATGLCLWLTLASARGRRLHQAALLGFMLVQVAFSPANYYAHAFFVLAMLAGEKHLPQERGGPVKRADGLIWLVLLGICVGQYQTTVAHALDEHFIEAGLMLFGGYAMLWLILLEQRYRCLERRIGLKTEWLF